LDPTRSSSLQSIFPGVPAVNCCVSGLHQDWGRLTYFSYCWAVCGDFRRFAAGDRRQIGTARANSYTQAAMDRLWTPWRHTYVSRTDRHPRKGVPAALEAWEGDLGCVFCNMIAAVDYAVETGMSQELAEQAANIVYRGETCFVCLNAFPYSTGHVMVIPYRHTDSLAGLEDAEAGEMMRLAQRTETCLREVYRPDGLNFGLNLGEAAGAGIAHHIHLHGLPRWSGDTNFMTVIGETRVLPEALDITWAKLRAAFA
jgi:ATP adenylyltransferase